MTVDCKQVRVLGWLAVVALCTVFTAEAADQSGSIDTTRSRVYIYVGKTGAGHAHGVEGALASGQLNLSGGTPAGNLTFDLAKFTADTSAARQLFKLPDDVDADTRTQVNATMLGQAVLNVEKYPTAQFVVKRVQILSQMAGGGTTRYQFDGDLTLHGTPRPLAVTATAEAIQGMIRLRGKLTLKQTDFGMKPYTKFLGVVGVADELQILGEIWVRP